MNTLLSKGQLLTISGIIIPSGVGPLIAHHSKDGWSLLWLFITVIGIVVLILGVFKRTVFIQSPQIRIGIDQQDDSKILLHNARIHNQDIGIKTGRRSVNEIDDIDIT